MYDHVVYLVGLLIVHVCMDQSLHSTAVMESPSVGHETITLRVIK